MHISKRNRFVHTVKTMESRKTEGCCLFDTTSTRCKGNEIHMWIPSQHVEERRIGRAESSFSAVLSHRARSSHETPPVAAPRQGVVVTDCDPNDSCRFHGENQVVNAFTVKASPRLDVVFTNVTSNPERKRRKDFFKPSDPVEPQQFPKQFSDQILGNSSPSCPSPHGSPKNCSRVSHVLPTALLDCQELKGSLQKTPCNSTLPRIILATLDLKDGTRLRVVANNVEGQFWSKVAAKLPFPVTVQRLINECHHDRPNVMRWEHNGSAFSVCTTHPDLSSTLASYYAHAKFSSFQRQLNSYGWKKCVKGKFAGMYFNARFHRNKSFQELCSIPRGYKTSSPPDYPSTKPGRKRGVQEHQVSSSDISEPEPSQNGLQRTESDMMLESTTEPITFHFPTQCRQDSVPLEHSFPILTTPKKENVNENCGLISICRDVRYTPQQDFGSWNFSKKSSHPSSGAVPDSIAKCTSPWTAIPLTPSRLLLSSQVSQSDSWDWGCSPPVGVTSRGDILGPSALAVEPVEKSMSDSRGFRDFTDIHFKSVEDGNKDIPPVQVHFDGTLADISPLVPKLHRFSSRL